MKKILPVLFTALTLFTAPIVSAAESGKTISPPSAEVKSQAKVIVPRAEDILTALDRLTKDTAHEIQWDKLLAYLNQNQYFNLSDYKNDDATTALNIGLRIANGFVAV